MRSRVCLLKTPILLHPLKFRPPTGRLSPRCGRGLRRALRAYVEYDSKSRTHVSLDKDAPFSRRVESRDEGEIVAIPHLGGLHHHYERRAA